MSSSPEASCPVSRPSDTTRMRTALIAGNWKMNTTRTEAIGLARAVAEGVGNPSDREVMIAPPFTALDATATAIEGSAVALGAQDMFWEESGAFTGEVSAAMLCDLGCRYVIVGHSERRQHFGSTDYTVAKKAVAALAAGLRPVVCVGESLEQRDAGATIDVVSRQVAGSLFEIPAEAFTDVVVAYEPVWAIGTGRTASPDEAQEVHAAIRRVLAEVTNNREKADAIRILYGGSVKPDNVDSLMACPDIDGALVGGASLKAEDFLRIVQFEDTTS